MTSSSKIKIFNSLLLATFASSPLYAENIDEKLNRLEQMLEAQQVKISEQEAKLNSQTSTISNQKSTLDTYQLDLQILRQDVMQDSRGTGPGDKPTPSLAQKPVGQAPAKVHLSKPEVGALADIGGVLTPEGRLIIEPSFQYSHSDVNRLTFRGIEILSSLAIGILAAEDNDRDSVTAALTGRLGLTNRLELELKIPYVYRDDRQTALIPDISMTGETTRDLDGNGLGDIEVALHYQLNNGQNGWPFFIANGRFKSTTGDGPFDISRNADGIENELATGSGFYSFEPSITALFPSAPAVFFANAGYLINFEDDINENLASGATEQIIGKVDPGDAVRFSFGMAYSINERAAFTLGFKNDWIQKTKTEINNTTFKSNRLTVASMLLGYSYQLTNKTGINLNLEFGMTDDAPDFLLTFRMPITTEALWN